MIKNGCYLLQKWARDGSEAENTMLAGRNIGILVGVFTMTGNSELIMIITKLHSRLLLSPS